MTNMSVPFASSASSPCPAHHSPHNGTVPRWRHTAAAALLASHLVGLPAWALTLGPVTVQSPLGEPLRAQIELPGLSAQALASLQVQLGSAADFAVAQMALEPLAADVRFQARQLDAGRAVLLLNTQRAVREPVLELVVQAQTANGRVLRSYTLLFDPPTLTAAAAPTTAPLVRVPAPAAQTAQPLPAPASAAAVTSPDTPATHTVRAGQTASRIAQAYRPAGITLEQMLVALLQANPQAFADGNLNRLRAGAVLQLPAAQRLQALEADAARQVVQAQSQDFDAYRQRLAAASPAAAPSADTRGAGGQVQAEVTDSRPTPPVSDRLTLAQGAADAALAAQTAQRAQADSEARLDEAQRNLDQLAALQAQVQGAASAPAAVAVDAPATSPSPAAPAPQLPAPNPVGDEASQGWLQAWLAHPLALPAAGGLGVLLLLLALLRHRRRQPAALSTVASPPPAAATAAPAPMASGLPPAPEAQASALMFSASQMAHEADTDAGAEADVFMAYGRHAQAEDILREALHSTPDSLPLHLKLLQVQRMRDDRAGFAGTAQALHTLTGGQGEAWAEALALGRAFLPDHGLFGAADRPAPPVAPPLAEAAPQAAPRPVPPPPAAAAVLAPLPAALAASAPVPSATPDAAPAEVTAPLPTPAPAADAGLDFDFDLDLGPAAGAQAAPPPPAPARAPAPAPAPAAADAAGLDFDLDFSLGSAAEQTPASRPADQLLPPSLHDLSLDLEVQEDDAHADPLETQLGLAREFAALGDDQGARVLAQAVANAAQGELQARARAFLAELG